MTDWFTLHRQDWIAEMLDVYGFINRIHIMRKFGISRLQAAVDLRDFQDKHPDRVRYNGTNKRYENITLVKESKVRKQQTTLEAPDQVGQPTEKKC